ncbi:hypothetical protein RvY_08744 [Ramazzottius varieornatus]|uniref:Uncharacterized protein n=1 Tax=Ramazzottius varieornatus TaxID=947166 RepID=A0A1D1V9I4_RAMVA|nr:hypothetical protein RvY_08744 [Ramazzottius varieornatus]
MRGQKGHISKTVDQPGANFGCDKPRLATPPPFPASGVAGAGSVHLGHPTASHSCDSKRTN